MVCHSFSLTGNLPWETLLINTLSCQCAVDQGHLVQEAKPATTIHFNQHPKGVCRVHHPQAVQWTLGCNLHRGVLDDYGHCQTCQQEKKTGVLHPATLLRQTVGYPGDDYL